MKVCRTALLLCFFALAFATYAPSAYANTWNQSTELTFNSPVQIPGAVLPAGTYWFVLADMPSDRSVVEIFNHNHTCLLATDMTVPTYRDQRTSKTEIRFAERPHGSPVAILQWFYPGRLQGHEFLYRHKEERELVRDAKLDVVVAPMG